VATVPCTVVFASKLAPTGGRDILTGSHRGQGHSDGLFASKLAPTIALGDGRLIGSG